MTYPAPMPTAFRHTTHRVRRALVLLGIVVAIGTVLAPSLTAPASAADNGLWSVFPTTVPGELTQRPYFSPLLRPGVPVTDSVTITNKTDAPIDFNLAAVDAFNTSEGGYALRPSTAPKQDMGAWITLSQDSATVPAKSAIVVPFTINPPADATPGDHPGGIVAVNTKPVVNKRGDLVINQLYAVGTRVYGRVEGPLKPHLDITGMHIDTNTDVGSAFGGSVDAVVTYKVTNTGNVRLDPIAKLSVDRLIGGSKDVKPLRIPELLPRGSAIVHQKVNGIWPWGRLTASLKVTSGAPTATAEVTAWVVPWLLLLLLLLVIVGVIGVVWWRGREGAAASTGTGPPTS